MNSSGCRRTLFIIAISTVLRLLGVACTDPPSGASAGTLEQDSQASVKSKPPLPRLVLNYPPSSLDRRDPASNAMEGVRNRIAHC